jgi:hypothetical protein
MRYNKSVSLNPPHIARFYGLAHRQISPPGAVLLARKANRGALAVFRHRIEQKGAYRLSAPEKNLVQK